MIAGAVYQQRIQITVDQEHYSSTDFSIRLIGTTVADTTLITPTDPMQAQHILLNQQVQLGTEYCFLIDLSIGGGLLTNHAISTCATAEL